MAPVAFALALFLQAQPVAAEPPADAAAPAEDRLPPGAPRDDYQFVAWCYGSLRGYLDLHDQVMPEVTRIESTYRPPGRKLSDDLKVYDDMQKEGRAQLKLYQSAIVAAERASLRPINTVGAAAVAKGHEVWKAGPDVTPARLAQAWMSWALPARCETVAKNLQAKATLMGASFKVNDEPEAPPADGVAAPKAAPSPIETLLRPEAPPQTPPAPEPKPN
jgi:hypothetical protein